MELLFTIFMALVGIYGILLLTGGWMVSNNIKRCSVEKSVRKATYTSIFLGTFLLSISICYISFSWSYRKYSNQLNSKANTYFGARALFVTFGLITGIIATSLGSVIKDGIHDDQEEVIDSTCDKIKSGANLMWIPGIIEIILCVFYFIILGWQWYNQRKVAPEQPKVAPGSAKKTKKTGGIFGVEKKKIAPGSAKKAARVDFAPSVKKSKVAKKNKIPKGKSQPKRGKTKYSKPCQDEVDKWTEKLQRSTFPEEKCLYLTKASGDVNKTCTTKGTKNDMDKLGEQFKDWYDEYGKDCN